MVADRTIDTPLFEDEPDASPDQTESPHDSKREKEISICERTFEVALEGWVPKLHDARALDETLLRPIRYCHTTWRDGVAAFRQELIELSQHWNELGSEFLPLPAISAGAHWARERVGGLRNLPAPQTVPHSLSPFQHRRLGASRSMGSSQRRKSISLWGMDEDRGSI